MWGSKVLLVTGSFVLLHAAYSLQHYRSLIQSLEEAATGVSIDMAAASTATTATHRMPPMDVWIELAVAFGLLLVAELTRTGSSLQPAAVRKGVRQKPLMAPPYISRDFDIYTSRGRGFTKSD